jgi:hypothetical protein
MALEYSNGATSGVLRLRANDGGWTPVHVTINRMELEPDTNTAMMTLRLPTEDELAVVDFTDDDNVDDPSTAKQPRKSKKRKKDKKAARD